MRWHKFIFFFVLSIAYGCIFFRVEYWPFTDWRVYPYSVHHSHISLYKLYIYDSKGDKVTLRIRKNGLTRIQIKALLKVENREIREEKFLSLLLDSNNFKKRLSRRDCPCIFVLGHNYIKKDDTGYKFFEDVKIEVNYE